MSLGTEAPEIAREGPILAARWSIERLHRPAAAELVWLGYAKPEVLVFDCLACGEGGFKQGAVRSLGRTLYICPACASHQVHPPTLPAALPVGFERRTLLETGLRVRAAAATAARVMRGRERGRMLDLACGLGMTVDIVRYQPGWTAAGVDVGPLQALGAEVIGAPLAHCDARVVADELERAVADVILCDGALDRSTDPLALLRLVAGLAPDAAWFVAAADAALLYSSPDGLAVRSLVDNRILIPSRVGLRRLLERAGFGPVAIRCEDGRILVDHPGPPAVADPGAAGLVIDRYLQARQAAMPEDAAAGLGLLVAALGRMAERCAAGSGNATEAGRLLARLAPALAAAGEAARNTELSSLETLFHRAPVCSSELLYEAGMTYLHAFGPSTQALMCFELAASLSGRLSSLMPAPRADEVELYWGARLQAARISRAMGDLDRSMAALRAIIDDEERAAVPAPRWVARAQEEIDATAAAVAERPSHRRMAGRHAKR